MLCSCGNKGASERIIRRDKLHKLSCSKYVAICCMCKYTVLEGDRRITFFLLLTINNVPNALGKEDKLSRFAIDVNSSLGKDSITNFWTWFKLQPKMIYGSEIIRQFRYLEGSHKIKGP